MLPSDGTQRRSSSQPTRPSIRVTSHPPRPLIFVLTCPASSRTIRYISQRLPPPSFSYQPLLQPPFLLLFPPASLARASGVSSPTPTGMKDPIDEGFSSGG